MSAGDVGPTARGGPGTLPDPSTFSSGEHGTVGGRRGGLRRLGDFALDAWLGVSGARRGLRELGERTPARHVVIAGVHGDDPLLLEAAIAEMLRSRHSTHVVVGSATKLGGGKFQNLNALLRHEDAADWVVVVDDDVAIPGDFLDGFIGLCEQLELDLAQPAQTLASHAAWRSARRRPFTVVRETNFVEIGPLTAFSRRAAAELLPFPDLRMGWGLDLHWAALARERGWRLGVIDALPVRHESRPVAGAYGAEEATAEAQQFLAERPYLDASEAGRTLRMHRRVPR